VLLRIALSYQEQQTQLSEGSANAVELIWNRIVGDVSDDTQDQFAELAARTVEAFRTRSVLLAEAYLRTYETLATDQAPTQPRSNVVDITKRLRGGVPLEEVYRRPVVTARAALSRGEPLPSALRIGRLRAVASADTDATLAAREASRDVMERSSRIVGYRRVPDSNACSFCHLVSTQRYRTDELNPIHTKCHCSVMPIIGSRDPGRVLSRLVKEPSVDPNGVNKINPDDVEIREHGELGPVLSLKSHSFTTSSEVS